MNICQDIPGYGGLYAASIGGSIWSHPKKAGGSFRKGRWLNGKLTHHGYKSITLCRNNQQKTYFIHRIIAMLYIDNPNNYPQVNHKNSIRTDNRIENLEWCTQSMNNQHAFDHGNKSPTIGESCGTSKLTEKNIIEIRDMLSRKIPQSKIAIKYGVKQSTISKINTGLRWRHV